jgi:hypothetical protein
MRLVVEILDRLGAVLFHRREQSLETNLAFRDVPRYRRERHASSPLKN